MYVCVCVCVRVLSLYQFPHATFQWCICYHSKTAAKETVRVGAMLLKNMVREPTLPGRKSAPNSQIRTGLLNVQNYRTHKETQRSWHGAIETVTNIGITNIKVHLQRETSILYQENKTDRQLQHKTSCTNTNRPCSASTALQHWILLANLANMSK